MRVIAFRAVGVGGGVLDGDEVFLKGCRGIDDAVSWEGKGGGPFFVAGAVEEDKPGVLNVSDIVRGRFPEGGVAIDFGKGDEIGIVGDVFGEVGEGVVGCEDARAWGRGIWVV